MSTYCISDVHGHPDALFRLLDKVSPATDDAVYILGDIVDRGPGTVRLLEFAVNEAPPTMRFLLGNHEDLLASWLLCRLDPDNHPGLAARGSGWTRHEHPYTYNTDGSTLRSVRGDARREWLEGAVVPWIASLPLHAVAEAGGQRFMLVHAGFNPRHWEDAASSASLMEGEAHWIPYVRKELVDLTPEGFGTQSAQTMIWARDEWLGHAADSPLPVVCGHTPTQNWAMQQCVENIPGASGAPGRICHIANRHIIDCGCGYHRRFRKTWNLAALRLDDMQEFYLRP